MKRFKNILYHADGIEAQGRSLDQAVALAQNNDAALTVMDVVADSNLAAEVEQRFDLKLNTLLRRRRLEKLESLIETHRGSGVRIYTQVVSALPSSSSFVPSSSMATTCLSNRSLRTQT